MAELSESRLRRVRVTAGSDTSERHYSNGSGYLVAPGRVLTAAHVVKTPGRQPVSASVGDICEILGPSVGDDWRPGRVAWVDLRHDLALVQTDAALEDATVPHDNSVVSFGELDGSDIVEWRTAGFPAVAVTDHGRDVVSVWGTASPLGAIRDQRLALVVASGEPVLPDGTANWGGLSGAPVFSGGWLVGVITDDPELWTSNLRAARIAGPARSAAFGAALGVAPVVRLANAPADSGDGALVAARVAERFEETLSRVFVGRDGDLARLDAWVAERESGRLVVTAPSGFGKSALLVHWIQRLQAMPGDVAFHLIRDGTVTAPVENVFRHLLRQIGQVFDWQPVPQGASQLDLEGRLVHATSASPANRLVIVIDGLDEATGPFVDPFSRRLPPGIFVVVSGRAHRGDAPLYLQHWLDDCDGRVELGQLDEAAVATWLRRAGAGELARLADDATFVAHLTSRTEGAPRYLRHVVADLASAVADGHDPVATMELIPVGFERYVRQVAANLSGMSAISRSAFHLLMVARSPLSEDELAALVYADIGLTVGRDEFVALRHEGRLARWLNITTGRDGRNRYAFDNPNEARLFATCTHPDSDRASKTMLAWCAAWREHGGNISWRYAIRNLAGHLLDGVPEHHEGRREPPMTIRQRLYDLADDDAFLRLQAARFPDEPDMPLRTIQAAIRAAARTDDAAAIARFVLRHSARLVAVRSSPLDALESGATPAEARTLADLSGGDDAAIWYLLLAWRMKAEGPRASAATVERLLHRDPAQLSGWRKVVAAALLAAMAPNGDGAILELAGRLLPADEQVRLIGALIDRARLAADGEARTSLVAAQALSRRFAEATRCVLLAHIATAMIDRRLLDEAGAALAECNRLNEQGVGTDATLAVLAPSVARLGDIDRAWQMAGAITDHPSRVRTMLSIATIAADAGDRPAAVIAFEHIRRLISVADAWQEWSSLATLVDPPPTQTPVQERTDSTTWWTRRWYEGYAARRTGRSMVEILDGYHPLDPYDEVMFCLALARTGADDDIGFTRAIARAASACSLIDDAGDRAVLTIDVAQVVIDRGPEPAELLEQAIGAAVKAPEPSRQAALLRRIAGVQRDAGISPVACLDAAAEATRRVPDPATRIRLQLALRADAEDDRYDGLVDETVSEMQGLGADERISALLGVVPSLPPAERLRLGADALLDSAIDSCADPAYRTIVLLALAQLDDPSADRPTPATFLQRAADAAAEVGAPVERVARQIAVAERAAVTGDDALAAQAWTAALQSCSQIPDADDRRVYIALVIGKQARLEYTDEVMLALTSLADPEGRVIASWAVATTLESDRLVDTNRLLQLACTTMPAIPDVADTASALVAFAGLCSPRRRHVPVRSILLDGTPVPDHPRPTAVREGVVPGDGERLAKLQNAVVTAASLPVEESSAALRTACDLAAELADPLLRARAFLWLATLDDSVCELAVNESLSAAEVIADPLAAVVVALAVADTCVLATRLEQARLAVSAARDRAASIDDDGLRVAASLATDEAIRLPQVRAWSSEELHPSSTIRAALRLDLATAQMRCGLFDDARTVIAAAEKAVGTIDGPEADGVRARIVMMRRSIDPTASEALHSSHPVPVDQPAEPSASGNGGGSVPAADRITDEITRAIEAGDWRSAGRFFAKRLEVELLGPRHLRWLALVFDRVRAEGGPVTAPKRQFDREDPDAIDTESSLRPAASIAGENARSGAGGVGSFDGGRAVGGAEGARMALPRMSAEPTIDEARERATILSTPGRRFIADAHEAATKNDRDGFEATLIPCAYHPQVVVDLIALLPRVYPLQFERIDAEIAALAAASA